VLRARTIISKMARKQKRHPRMMGACALVHRAAKPGTGVRRCKQSVLDATRAIQQRMCATSKFRHQPFSQ